MFLNPDMSVTSRKIENSQRALDPIQRKWVKAKFGNGTIQYYFIDGNQIMFLKGRLHANKILQLGDAMFVEKVAQLNGKTIPAQKHVNFFCGWRMLQSCEIV